MKRFFSLLVFSLLFAQACKEVKVSTQFADAHQYDYKVYWEWNELFMDLDQNARGYRPGPGPRALAYLGLSAYEAVVAGIPENNSLESLYTGLSIPDADPNLEYYWPACVNESYAFLMKRFFFHMEATHKEKFDKIEQLRVRLHTQYASETDGEVLDRSVKFGQEVASAVYEWEKTDLVGHNAFLDPQPVNYTPPAGAGLWAPTPPDFSRAVFPQWGQVRTFAIKETDKLCRAPWPYSEDPKSVFFNQAAEVYNRVNLINNNLPGGYEQHWIAIFWSDDILDLTFAPPTRLVAVANQVVDIEKTDLAGCAELYAKLGLALSDNGVAIWHSKYVYNVERPVSYIRRVLSKHPDFPDAGNWLSILNNIPKGVDGVTPAFPAYPSGHSGFGGAGGKILSSFFEYTPTHPGTYTFTDNCHRLRTEFIGTPRTYSSFKQLADEDAYSRIPLGVHYRMDCEVGLEVGELCAQRVLELPWKK